MASSSTHSTTTILNLNDECLRGVFDFLALDDLLVVADVCAHFRKTTKAHFAHSADKDDYCDILSCTSYYMLQRTSKILRHFGSFMTTINIDGEFDNSRRNELVRSKHQTRLMRLVNLHWSETITNLQLNNISINDEIASSMRPILLRLKSLSFEACHWEDSHLQKLALDAPELHHLKFSDISFIPWTPKLHGLDQTFPKLQSISFAFDNVKHSEIKQFLARNPKLKNIGIEQCCDVDEGRECSSIIQLIAKYVPEVESINFFPHITPDSCDCDTFFGHFRKLNALHIVGSDIYLTSVVTNIVATDIHLENLDLGLLCEYEQLNRTDDDGLVDAIAKLKTVSTLRITNAGRLSQFDFMKICKSLSELSELHLNIIPTIDLGINTVWSEDDLLELIQNAEKLKVLDFRSFNSMRTYFIDADFYMKMLKIVERRPEKIHLTIVLAFGFHIDVPSALAKAHNDSLTVKLWNQ